MAKYHVVFSDPHMVIPVQFTTPDFDSSNYILEKTWLWQDGVPVGIPIYYRIPDWQSRDRQLAAQLVIFVSEQMSWTLEKGLELWIDTDHMYIDPVDDAWVRDDIPWDQQNPIVANNLTREVFFTAYRMLGATINQID